MADGEAARDGETPKRVSFEFDADQAFSRNIGWLTESEQHALRYKTVAIAGMGGVGGIHALTLARLGIERFHLADMDTFELANFNRQVGATVSTIGKRKTDVIAGMVHDINPHADVTCFSDGIDETNIDAFLDGADLFIDGFDFFVLDIRAKVFARCAELGIPALTAAPVGMGVAYMTFMPGGMTFEQYFRLDGQPTERQYVNFVTGLTPKRFHMRYLVDPTRVDFAHQRVPSTGMACQLSAGVIGIESLKALLRPEDVKAVPWVHHFDAYRGKFWRGRIAGGNRHPLQFLKRQIGYRMFARMSENARPVQVPNYTSDIERILDQARWAPSGDNTQPWRFEIVSDEEMTIVVRDQADDDVYDYDNGRPSLVSAGMLLESISLASAAMGRRMEWHYLASDNHEHRISVVLKKHDDVHPEPLADFLPSRSVNRWPYRLRPLGDDEYRALETSVGEGYSIRWHTSAAARWRQARLNGRATDIRLRIKEAFHVHQRMLDWTNEFSETGVPAKAIGLDAATLKIMHWAMKSWQRMKALNAMPGGTLAARLQMDYLPGIACGAHFEIVRDDAFEKPRSVPELLAAGRAVQRFWLTATQLGLVMQPSIATLIFSHYGRIEEPFTEDERQRAKARALAADLDSMFPAGADRVVFRGRIGTPRSRKEASRSVRQPVASLIRA